MEIKEFNPTPRNQVDIERSILDLKREKSDYVAKKVKKQDKVSQIKDVLNNPHLSTKDYEKAKAKRSSIKRELSEIENEIRRVNVVIGAKRKMLISVNNHLKQSGIKTSLKEDFMKSTVLLKDKYSMFSADNTRISSMRVMAAEFVMELESIIHKSY